MLEFEEVKSLDELAIIEKLLRADIQLTIRLLSDGEYSVHAIDAPTRSRILAHATGATLHEALEKIENA